MESADVLFTWVPMLDSDHLAAANAMEEELGGAHFWDVERLAASAFARALGSPGELAWDAYLFYPAGDRWRDPAPVPSSWAHQLGPGGWAGAAQFASGADLMRRLAGFA